MKIKLTNKQLLNRLIKAYHVCLECGNEYGKQGAGASSWRTRKCDVCHKKVMVTESRDFGYLELGKKMIEGLAKKEVKAKKKEKKLNSNTYLKKEADRLFSIFIRKRDTDEDGMVKCCTCQTVRKWNDRMQCGHWIHRDVLSTRYDESNCHGQCVGCNMFGGGKEHKHEKYIIARHGAAERDRLLVLSEVIIPDFDYKSIIKKYDKT
jgi:hypothetical protein